MIPAPLAPLFTVALDASQTARWLTRSEFIPPADRWQDVEQERKRHGGAAVLATAADELATAAGRQLAAALVAAVEELLAYRPVYKRADVTMTVPAGLVRLFGGRTTTYQTWDATPASKAKLTRLRMKVRGLFERVAALLGDLPPNVGEGADPIIRVIDAAHLAAGRVLPADRAARVRRWLGSIRAGE